MPPVKARALAWLVAGMALAILTPLYVAWAAPGEAVYHRNVFVVLLQAVPYAICAALWLPAASPAALRTFRWLAIALFVASCLVNGGWWIHPGPAGDMVGLGYLIVCVALSAAVVLVSVVAFVVMWWSDRRHA